MLLLSSSEVRDVFDLSTSHNLTAPLYSIKFTVQSENEMKIGSLQLRSSEVREVFDLSASNNNLIATSERILLSVLSEHETKQQMGYF
jgi:hypothetical protein